METAEKRLIPRRRRWAVAAFLISLMAYLAFLPTGPYPLDLGGLRLEYLLLGAVFLTTLPLLASSLRKITGNYARVQLCCFGYLGMIALSTALSSDASASNRAFGSTLCYAYLMCIVPPLIYRHMSIVRTALLLLATATACLLLYLHVMLGFGKDTARFALAESAEYIPGESSYVDPNMTAIGMLLCVFVSLPLLSAVGRKQDWLRRTSYYCLLGVVVGAALLFISRTAVFSLVIAVAFGLTGVIGRGLRVVAIVRRGLPIVLVLIAVTFWRAEDLTRILDRSSDLVESETRVSGRVDLFQGAWDGWLSSTKAVIIGNGYYSSNPHNEFLRTLDGDGLLGFVALLSLLFAVYLVCCRAPSLTVGQRFCQNALFAFIMSAMMTYGHTKTMWLALMFLLAGYLEAQDGKGGSRETSTSLHNSGRELSRGVDAYPVCGEGTLPAQ